MDNQDLKNPTNGIGSGKEPLNSWPEMERLARAFQSYRDNESWRQRREAGLAISAILTRAGQPELGRKMAEDMTGLPPEQEWLTVTEAAERLLKHGVQIYPRLLYRLYEKARLAHGAMFTVVMNAHRKWDCVGSPRVRHPLVTLTIRVSGAVHFKVTQIRSKV
ncbi:MAG: hypothetical protein NTW87_05550 [Planctomycetota bacterium]|nr:hypothetical protein [Planctomycetota bacterium]